MINQSLALQTTWQDMVGQAEVLIKSGFLPNAIKTKEQALAIMLKGQELGIPAWSALTGIYIIQGTPTVSPQLMLAMINRTGLLEDIQIEGDDASCTVAMKRKGRTPHAETFTTDDAKKMQLDGKDNWKKQVAVMLKWRAVSACARVVFPDVIAGLYMPEEINPDVQVDSEGVIIEGTYTTKTNAETGEIIEPEVSEERTIETMLEGYRKIVPSDFEINPNWYQITDDPDQLEEYILDDIVDSKVDISVWDGFVVKTEKGLYYALDLGFNRSKKVYLKQVVEKSHKVDQRVDFDLIATLTKNDAGNYVATPVLS